MEEYKRLRDLMVSSQLVGRGIVDERVLTAMRRVPRHLFIPEPVRHTAYDDMAMSIGEGQTISQPYMVAVMTELLELTGTETVLEVGTGSGYQAAILGELAAEVYTVERIAILAEKARAILKVLGYVNVHLVVGDGTIGFKDRSSFDRIIITAAAPEIPPPLVDQLSEGGIVVAPVGERYSQVLLKGRKANGHLVEEFSTPCSFVPLIGEHGWKV